ncbi:MAG: DUF2726 domain-containing protein [Thermoguttaceae bacterium]
MPPVTIQCKVGLGEIVKVLDQSGKSTQAGRNKVAQKHLDFVLYDARANKVLLVIELDDKSHKRENVQKRDDEKDEILRRAGIEIVRIPAATSYSPLLLKQQISDKVSITQL